MGLSGRNLTRQNSYCRPKQGCATPACSKFRKNFFKAKQSSGEKKWSPERPKKGKELQWSFANCRRWMAVKTQTEESVKQFKTRMAASQNENWHNCKGDTKSPVKREGPTLLQHHFIKMILCGNLEDWSEQREYIVSSRCYLIGLKLKHHALYYSPLQRPSRERFVLWTRFTGCRKP